MKPFLAGSFAAAALAIAAPAQFTHQITYVDIDPATNVTNADGTPVALATAPSEIDGLWTERPIGASNSGSLLASNFGGPALGGEDCPMLKVTIRGLIPGLPYNTYAYFWGDGSYNWSGRATVDTALPTAPIQGFESRAVDPNDPNYDPNFLPMQPLAQGCFEGHGQTTLGLTMDLARMDTSGHFVNPVKLSSGASWLFEVFLGAHPADANGEIWVYVDDREFAGHHGRARVDGVGYEIAPFVYSGGCGNAQIGLAGPNLANTDFDVTLDAADPNSLAVLLVGLNSQPAFDIAAYGLTPGCYLVVNSFASVFTVTDTAGSASFSARLPSLIAPPTPPSVAFYWQWAVLDAVPSVTEMTPGLETVFHN